MRFLVLSSSDYVLIDRPFWNPSSRSPESERRYRTTVAFPSSRSIPPIRGRAWKNWARRAYEREVALRPVNVVPDLVSAPTCSIPTLTAL